MNSAAIAILILFSAIAVTLTFIVYNNYQLKCDVSGGFTGRTVKTCRCAGVKVDIPKNPDIRDGYDENFCVGLQTPSSSITY